MYENSNNASELVGQMHKAQLESIEVLNVAQKSRTVCLLISTLVLNAAVIGGVIILAVKL